MNGTPNRGAIRLGVVGVGRIARDYLAVLRELPELQLVGVVDRDEGARTRAAAETSVPAFANVEALVRATEPEAALVLTPPANHEDASVELLQHGVHVLCEKPIATSTTGALRMFRCASRTGKLLMMASKFRYVPDVVEARRLLTEGVLGDVVLFTNVFCARADMTGRWNADPVQSGGGVLIDHGAHAVDLVRYLVGTIVKVLTHFGRKIQDVAVEDTVRVLVETDGGRVGVIDLSWSLSSEAESYLELVGTRGVLQLGWRRSRYKLADETEWVPFGKGYDKRDAFGRQLANFASAVRGREPLFVTEEDALASARTIDAAYRAARVERWVPVQAFHVEPH